MKRIVTILLAATLILSLAACGGNTTPSNSEPSSTPTQEENTEVTLTPPAQDASNTTEEMQEQEEPKREAVEIAIGDTISLDFVEITFEETGVAEDIQTSITTSIQTGTSTQITGPNPETGKQFVYMAGTIKNLSTEALPVHDFFEGNVMVDKYNYNITANNCNVITAAGRPTYTLDPLLTYTFIIYAAIPDELAEEYTSSTFTFGFYDLFDNMELSRNRAFSDNAIAECPHQYKITLK